MKNVSKDGFFKFVKNIDGVMKLSPGILEYKEIEVSEDGLIKIKYHRS